LRNIECSLYTIVIENTTTRLDELTLELADALRHAVEFLEEHGEDLGDEARRDGIEQAIASAVYFGPTNKSSRIIQLAAHAGMALFKPHLPRRPRRPQYRKIKVPEVIAQVRAELEKTPDYRDILVPIKQGNTPAIEIVDICGELHPLTL